MTFRKKYLPAFELKPGMVLARPLILSERSFVTFQLAAGHALTEANIEQLIAHHAEYACIQEEDQRTPAEVDLDITRHTERLHHIFRQADLDQPATRGLFDALLTYRNN